MCGAIEIDLLQSASIASRPPRQILVQWAGAAALAWDGQRNYMVKADAAHGLIWEWPEQMETPLLPQGTRWTIGWLRMDSQTELEFSIIGYEDF